MLDIQNVTVRFGPAGTPNAIEQVSLAAPDRQKTFLIGETGSGKSVLLLAILQMLPKSAHVEGRALLDGMDVMALPPKEIRKIRGSRIAYIPQGSGNGMNPLLTVGLQVGEPLMIHQGLRKRPAKERALQLLRQLDLGNEEQLIRQYPYTLSGGMKQRSLIAMGVIADAGLLFADEPTKGQDTERIRMIAETFERLPDKTLLCVTHDLRFARNMADQIAVMYASEEVETASKSDFFREPLHPYSRAILRALPENGLQVTKGFAPPRADAELAKGCRYALRCDCCTQRCRERPPLIDLGNRKVRCWHYVD